MTAANGTHFLEPLYAIKESWNKRLKLAGVPMNPDTSGQVGAGNAFALSVQLLTRFERSIHS